jgi:hypothetical protein
MAGESPLTLPIVQHRFGLCNWRDGELGSRRVHGLRMKPEYYERAVGRNRGVTATGGDNTLATDRAGFSDTRIDRS